MKRSGEMRARRARATARKRAVALHRPPARRKSRYEGPRLGGGPSLGTAAILPLLLGMALTANEAEGR